MGRDGGLPLLGVLPVARAPCGACALLPASPAGQGGEEGAPPHAFPRMHSPAYPLTGPVFTLITPHPRRSPANPAQLLMSRSLAGESCAALCFLAGCCVIITTVNAICSCHKVCAQKAVCAITGISLSWSLPADIQVAIIT